MRTVRLSRKKFCTLTKRSGSVNISYGSGSGWPFNFGSGQIPNASWTLLVAKILNSSVKTVTFIYENFFVSFINNKVPDPDM
jgi:hypothetical protein